MSDRQLRRGTRAKIRGVLVACRRDEFHAQMQVQVLAQAIRRQIQFGHRQDRPFDIVGTTVVALLRMGPERIRRIQRILGQHEQRICAEVIEQRLRALEKQRQVILDSRRRRAFLQVLVQRAVARVDRKAFAQDVAECLDRFLRQREFARREQVHLVHFVQRALRFRIETADRVDLAVEQFDPVRFGRAHREDVDQRAAHGEVAGFVHLRHVAVAGGLQTLLFAGKVERLLQFEHETGSADEIARRQTLHQRCGGNHQHTTRYRRQPVQRGDALRNDLWMRREQVIGQGFPVREMQHVEIGAGEDSQVRFERMRSVRVARDRDDDAGVAPCRGGDGQCAGATGRRIPECAKFHVARQGCIEQIHAYRQQEQRRWHCCARRERRSLAQLTR